uniref:Uncharacterized protein n=1 Tax=Leersia perrieri TaxID=77586 RepID=A0A0D9WGN7_9ORYZ
MAIATPRHHIIILLLLLLAGAAAAVVSAGNRAAAEKETLLYGVAGDDDKPTAYEMLERFGFPRGILPEGVTAYTLRPSDGAFQVYLGTKDCEFEVPGGYRLTYRGIISGKVAGSSIRDLQGVSVKVFLMNWGIDRVVMADAGQLVFYVGPLSQAFPAGNFDESPQCRCRNDDAVAVK